MEAAPRLPMISFELKTSPEPVSFGPTLKQYIASFYHEEPESYSAEVHALESLRAAAVRPSVDVAGCQLLKRYYSQLSFLKSRFPMGKGQAAAVTFSWRDAYAGVVCSAADIDFEMGCVLYNIGALHTQLGAADSRSTADGMKLSCSHFQCAAWAFQHLREHYAPLVPLAVAPDLLNFMAQLCLAQAQECILEKSMMDNRKASIIARVAAQVVDYYGQALATLAACGTGTGDDTDAAAAVGARVARDWSRHLTFKATYHGCVALLYQGQQAEEQQKMGERVAYYQAASEALERARRAAADAPAARRADIDEALAFTQDVVEGKRKAARNENEFIYHERVPERDALPRAAGASLVKGVAFSVADPDVSGPDIFRRLVPMEAHEASSVYSEQKAEMLRQVVALVEAKDAELAEYVSSLRLDFLQRWRQATAVPQEVVDRAAALCARPHAVQALVDAMARLSGACRDVDALLAEIRALVAQDERSEREYQTVIGGRPPGLVATELSREAAKYAEAHAKAHESNDALHRAMSAHVANLRALQRPLAELRASVPCAPPAGADPAVDEAALTELEALAAKVDEMRAQRGALVAGLREAVRADDITALLVTRPPDIPVEQLFQRQLAKHGRQAALIEQNLAAQQNILAAMTDAYARAGPSRRHIADVLRKRDATASALVASYDAYDDLLAKANKGIDFYQKLEANVSKLLQRVRSACRVNDEERDQMLASSGCSAPPTTAAPQPLSTSKSTATATSTATSTTTSAPKLKDYLASMKQAEATGAPWAVPAVRPAPLGSEAPGDAVPDAGARHAPSADYYYSAGAYTPQYSHTTATYYAPAPASTPMPTATPLASSGSGSAAPTSTYPTYAYQPQASYAVPNASYPISDASYAAYAMPYSSSVTSTEIPAAGVAAVPASYTPGAYSASPYSAAYQPYAAAAGGGYEQYYPAGYQQHGYATQPQPQYTNAGGHSTCQTDSQQAPGEAAAAAAVAPQYYFPAPYGYQTPGATPLTMVHANNHNAMTSSSQSDVRAPAAAAHALPLPDVPAAATPPSNVDLLAGLDITVTQAPLVPQVSGPPVTVAARSPEPPADVQHSAPVTMAAEPAAGGAAAADEEAAESEPLDAPGALEAFAQEVERLQKCVAGLTTRSLNGPTPLDLKWKEVQERQERGAQRLSISVARCYPLKNRCADTLPFDQTRVALPSAKDDYINASHVRRLGRCPPLIVTQAPLPATLLDFWTMVCEQQVEVAVCLLSAAEVRAAGAAYWPEERGADLWVGTRFRVAVRGLTEQPHWTERVLAVTDAERPAATHVLVHLQFGGWPGGGLMPAEPAPLLHLVRATLACHRQQKARGRPVLVHCLSGVGRSGVFCTLLAVACDPSAAFDVPRIAADLGSQRKNALRDREHLRFTYTAALQLAQETLAARRGAAAATGTADDDADAALPTRLHALSVEGGAQSASARDPLSALDPLWTINK